MNKPNYSVQIFTSFAIIFSTMVHLQMGWNTFNKIMIFICFIWFLVLTIRNWYIEEKKE